MPKPVDPIISATAPTPDPRVGLKAGRWDAGQAAWNMKMISTTPPSPVSLGATHSDLAFTGKYSTDYPTLFAALSIITIPMIAIYVIFHRQVIAGVTEGSVQ